MKMKTYKSSGIFFKYVLPSKAKTSMIKNLKNDKRMGYKKTISFKKVRSFTNDSGQKLNQFLLVYEHDRKRK